MKKIFIITGEYSGDIHASKVVKELRALNSDIEIEGIGGENLAAEGVNCSQIKIKCLLLDFHQRF